MLVTWGLPNRFVARTAEIVEALAELFLAAAVVYAVGKLLVVPAVDRLLARRRVEPTLERAIRRVVRTAVVLFAVAVGVAVAGFGHLLTASAVIVAAATVALGFAAQEVVGNVLSGVFIVADPTFNIGDWIEWDETAGVIEDISFRATRVRTFNNELVTVPNAELTATAVTNPVIHDTLRISLPIGVGYGADLDVAVDDLLAAAAAHPEILDDPAPSVRLIEFGDATVRLESRFWIADPARSDSVRIRSEYARDVKERFDDAGISLSPPSEHDLSGSIGVQDGTDRT